MDLVVSQLNVEFKRSWTNLERVNYDGIWTTCGGAGRYIRTASAGRAGFCTAWNVCSHWSFKKLDVFRSLRSTCFGLVDQSRGPGLKYRVLAFHSYLAILLNFLYRRDGEGSLSLPRPSRPLRSHFVLIQQK